MTPEYELMELLRAYDYGTAPFNEDSRAADLYRELEPVFLLQAEERAVEIFNMRVDLMKGAALKLYQNADSEEMITEYIGELLEEEE